MTATYNPAEVVRLVAEAREDDARMTRAPWETSEPPEWIVCAEGTVADTYNGRNEDRENSTAIARTRNSLRSVADQLEAAKAKCERLQADRDDLAEDYKRVVAERNAARAEVERMRSVFDASLAMRAADRGDAIRDDMSIAEAETIAAENRSGRALMRWRNAVDAVLPSPNARPCPTCGKPGCRPQEHAGWDPSKDLP